MSSITLNNSYGLLGAFLAPEKTERQKNQLIEATDQPDFAWESLLAQANQQLCTPLWYSQLKSDQLLDLLPEELAEYLATLYELNASRNQQMKEGLEEFLSKLKSAEIPTLLLKGAATFYDDLYGNFGSRIMGDLDILVPADAVNTSLDILLELGFEEIPDDNMTPIGSPTDERHHQSPRHFKPDTPVVVEVHFKTSYAQAGRCIDASQAWKSAQPIEIGDNITSHIMHPTERIILNTAHALLPHREFIRGHISLLQLSEFARLAGEHKDSINWETWHRTAAENNLTTEFNTYAALADELMGTEIPVTPPLLNNCQKHLRRLLSQPDIERPLPFRQNAMKQGYYYAKLPAWIWNNICYASGYENLPARITLFARKLLSRSSWSKI